MLKTEKRLISIIKDGGFTCLVKSHPFIDARLFITDTWIRVNITILQNIKMFYQCIRIYQTRPVIVYRGIRDSTFKHFYHCPIPFSTSKSITFASQWIEDNISSCLLQIYVHPFIPVLDSTHYINDEEEEITLAPGVLIFTNIYPIYIYVPYDSKWLLESLQRVIDSV